MLLEAILSPREPGMVRSASDWLSLIWVTYLGLFVKLLRASERPPHPVPLPPGERGPFLPLSRVPSGCGRGHPGGTR